MQEIHWGPCPAHSKCPENATYCEILMWSLEAPQNQVGATIEALSTYITQYQLVSTLGWFLHIGKWTEVTELAKKWNQEMEMVPWSFRLLIW